MIRHSWRQMRARRHPAPAYRVIDRLHVERSVNVTIEQISLTISGWLAEIGTASPLVDELSQAVAAGDWQRVRRIAECLSVDVSAIWAASPTVLRDP